MVRVAVLGAGIIGFSCAVKLKEKFKDYEVVLISKEFSPDTTGDGSGGLWYPYLCGTTPDHLIAKWGSESYYLLHKLCLEGKHKVRAVPMYCLYRKRKQRKRQDWADIVFGYQELNQNQLDYLSGVYSAQFVSGHTFTTLIIPPLILMEYMHQRFKNALGEVQQATVKSLDDPILAQYDVVVNCTGMGARELVPDPNVYPIRGQVAKVIAPWITECVIDQDGGNYIIPNAQTCVLGGTHQEHDFNTNVDDEDTQFILEGCKKMLPSLKDAKVVSHWAGLRPGRNEIRLEPEERNGKLYIHNYGHGGSGLTLFWGCATEVVAIMEKHFVKDKNIQTLMCK